MKELTQLPPGTIVPVSEAELRAGTQFMAVTNPLHELDMAGEIATHLAGIIEKKKLYKTIGKKKHVYVEGWTAVAALRGVTPREVSNERQEDGSYIAKVELVNAEGRVIGAASAECGGPEEPIWQNRAPYARRSMAATRATSKVCRLCFSWIMVLEGYSGTPAEEMEGFSSAPKTKKASQEPQAAQERPSSDYSGEWDGNLVIGSGKNKGKKWSEMPLNFLEWTQGGKATGAIVEMGAKELARRAALEGDVVDAEITREPGDDDDLPFGTPQSEDPRFA